MGKHSKLTRKQRYQLSTLREAGTSQKKIAEILKVHRSTIWRELKRNTPTSGKYKGKYKPDIAQKKTHQRQIDRFREIKFTAELKEQVKRLMMSPRWSPEQIARHWKDKQIDGVSKECIYKWLWACKKGNKKGDSAYKKLYLYLRHARRRTKRGAYKGNRSQIKHREPIDKRPQIIEERTRFGDFEVDLMIGKKTGPPLLVLVDRTTLLTKLIKLPNKNADNTAQEIMQWVSDFGHQKIKSFTFDNGLEFAKHYLITETFKIPTYFTRPYTSQDKGTVENRIGVIRRWFEKGKDLTDVSEKRIKQIQDYLNNRPVRKFQYLTPNQKFKALMGVPP